MIRIPPSLEIADTAVFGCDLARQVLRVYEHNPELGQELALAAIAYVMSGGTEISDNPLVNVILQGSESFVVKNRQKWETKQQEREEAEIEKKNLREIAALLRQGYKQIEISRELNIHKSTISDRVKLIKSKYNYLLSESSENVPTKNSDTPDNQSSCFKTNLSQKSEIRKFPDSGRTDSDSRFSPDFRTKTIASSKMNYENIGNLSENPKNPDGRNNVNGNVNGNVNKNVNSSLSPVNPSDSSGENYSSLDGSCPEKSRAGKKFGQIDISSVLKNPDESGQNDPVKIPMTPEQKAILRQLGYYR